MLQGGFGVTDDAASTLSAKLGRGRTELLDLSTRNRLINVPRRSKTAKTIEVVDELTEETFRILVSDGKTLTFLAGRRASGESPADDDEIALLAQPEDDGYDERGVANRHTDTKLQTRLTSEGLQKRLLTLHLDAKTIQEEQGVNILYLAMGMLKWFEDKNSDVERHAPLILVPVALERGNATERFKLKWLQEDPSPNLSLAALLKRQFGLELPEFLDEDQDGFDPAAYLNRVAKAVASQPRWGVLKDDIVLGFFSFSKFLMYRDLDPANWPEGAGLQEHPIIAGLLGEGFPGVEPLFGEDDPIDPHIAPEDMVHIVDADSSQAACVHEVRNSRNLVIQGPPGTGKSQTIANVIASAVHEGKKVLFVAEKMAALDVVKRRLDKANVGAVCLELHSNKTNKRNVLEELRRTWELGKPNGSSDGELVRQLGQYRDALNGHAARLHRRHEASDLTPFQTIGHLVKLRQAGQSTAATALVLPETWTRHEKEDREFRLKELAERIADIGRPADHPWRGVHMQAILPMELQRLLTRFADLLSRLTPFIGDTIALRDLLGKSTAVDFDAAWRLTEVANKVASAPDLSPEAMISPSWDKRLLDIVELVATGERLTKLRAELDQSLTAAAWETDVKSARQHIAVHGNGWFRWLNGDYKRAMALVRSISVGEPPKSVPNRLRLLDRLVDGQKAAAELTTGDTLGQEAFGAIWRSHRSDWNLLGGIIAWVRDSGESVAGKEVRTIAAKVDRRRAGEMAASLLDRLATLAADLTAVFAELKLDLAEAFGSKDIGSLDLAAVLQRLDLWEKHHEDLSKWTAFLSKSEAARVGGLGAFVERLAQGSLNANTVIPEFEMAYYEALMRDMAKSDPEIASFDGDGHSRSVQEFTEYDKKRIQLAQREVAAAHFLRIPRQDGGAGPLGVLKGEIARKRGHMPIRKLMKRAGPAIQALKPVFMMSPLSVAQFLEPGAVEFDILVVDEASQIQPVDALGAIARCKQVVVVGDDRQLPPTRFFAKMISGDDEDEDDDGGASVGDIESILGLCVSKGLPQRMLRWHYRSRHQSLIAVSNREFYENRLFIVPSPYTAQAGRGLSFQHVANGSFDSGNTAVNLIEAKAVAEAVIRHAKEHPKLSLGVAAFSSKQRRAIVDELELLRRKHPETEFFFTSAHPSEPYFIKNLENVQGDERDVIFISVGYGKNPQGYMAMRFGPLSSEGGERRLNVLISRAKQRCVVFASITDEDIDLERGKGKGVAALKLFLNFARTGKLGIGIATDREHDSVFEEQVAAALRNEGYDVHSQVGLAGFFIDLAIADFEKPGRFVIGIECDGVPYHSSRSARDRDRLRQAVLEDHGWIIHRIWSTDWFHRPQEQLKRTVAAIEAAKAVLAEFDNARTKSTAAAANNQNEMTRDDGTELVSETSVPSDMAVLYVEAQFDVPRRMPLHEVYSGQMSEIVRQVVEIEGPIHVSEVIARIRTLWGLQRAGNRIQDAVSNGIKAAISRGAVVSINAFLNVPNGAVQVRDRTDVKSFGLRKPEMLPPAEIRAAALKFVISNLGATLDETIQGCSRLFGFKATSSVLRDVIAGEIAAMIEVGLLDKHQDLLVAKGES